MRARIKLTRAECRRGQLKTCWVFTDMIAGIGVDEKGHTEIWGATWMYPIKDSMDQVLRMIDEAEAKTRVTIGFPSSTAQTHAWTGNWELQPLKKPKRK